MLKGYSYNKPIRKILTHVEEKNLIETLAEDGKDSIHFEYDTVKEAINATQNMKDYLKRTRHPYMVVQRKNVCIICKKHI